MARLSNDNADLVPRTAFDGPELRFDLPGLEVGVAEYEEGPTGCTVFHFPAGASAAVDVRGGSPPTSATTARSTPSASRAARSTGWRG